MFKNEKKELVKRVIASIEKKDLIFVDYQGLAVKDADGIRRELHERGGHFQVIKNTLLKRTAKMADIALDEGIYKGMSALITVGESFSETGRVIAGAEKTEKIKIKGGYYEGRFIDPAYVKKLASIPPRDVLYGMLVGSFKGVVSRLVYILESMAEKRKEKESGNLKDFGAEEEASPPPSSTQDS